MSPTSPHTNGARPEAPAEPSAAHGGAERCLEWCPICRTAEILRENASPELRASLAEAQQEALLTLRALIDSYLDHTGASSRREPGEQKIRDIPIG